MLLGDYNVETTIKTTVHYLLEKCHHQTTKGLRHTDALKPFR